MSDEAGERTAQERAAEVRGVIRLSDGRRISLARLYQYHTYAGLLAGLPDEAMNRRRIHEAVEYAQEKLGFAGFPRLIPPQVETKAFPARPHRGPRTAYYLPSTTCIGEFLSSAPARDADMPYSALTLIWYQDDFALPIAEGALAEIRRLEWGPMAEDWTW